MHYALSLVHAVADPDPAALFFVGALGFELRSRGAAHVVVDNGALSIRLEPAGDGPPASLELEVLTDDLVEALEELLAHEGVEPIGSPSRVSECRFEQQLRAPHGLELRLVRELTEDDLGVLPPLPTSLLWDRYADLMTRELLREVPLAFRANARESATRRAEELSLLSGNVEVSRDSAARALLEIAPPFRKEEVASALAARGIEVRPEEEQA